MKWLPALINLISMIVAKIKEERNQSERDKLEDNPPEWFNGHFGGLSTRVRKGTTDKTNSSD